jgi:hypothetical protein
MNSARFWPVLACLALCSHPAFAVDLTTIDRRIAKEPAYQSKTPKYCLLVFGPEAKARVWLVLDGRCLYVDRNGNGDLTEAGKRVSLSAGNWFAPGDIKGPDGKARNVKLRVRRFDDQSTGLIVVLDRKRWQFVGFDEKDPFQFGDRPEQAPIVHLDGPLTPRLYEGPPTFVPGRAAELDIAIGTPGLGNGSFAAIRCCTVLDCKVAPIAEVTFPHREAGHAPLQVLVAIPDD